MHMYEWLEGHLEEMSSFKKHDWIVWALAVIILSVLLYNKSRIANLIISWLP